MDVDIPMQIKAILTLLIDLAAVYIHLRQ